MSYDELLDSIFAGEETVAALTAGLLCACSNIGVDVATILPPVDSFPIGPQIQTLATYFSWRDIEVFDISGNTIEIAAELPKGPPSWDAIFAISSIVPQDVKLIRITTRGGHIKAEVPLEFMRGFISGEGIDQQLSYIRFQRNATIEGIPLYDEDKFRYFIACHAIQALVDDDLTQRIRTLRKLKNIAEIEGDGKLAAALAGSIAVQRAGWIEMEASEHEAKDYKWLIEYTQRSFSP
jgi:hypothetical protein